jgi:hypothetical protein
MKEEPVTMKISGGLMELAGTIERLTPGRERRYRAKFTNWDPGPGRVPICIDLYLSAYPNSTLTPQRVVAAAQTLLDALLVVLQAEPELYGIFLETYPPRKK